MAHTIRLNKYSDPHLESLYSPEVTPRQSSQLTKLKKVILPCSSRMYSQIHLTTPLTSRLFSVVSLNLLLVPVIAFTRLFYFLHSFLSSLTHKNQPVLSFIVLLFTHLQLAPVTSFANADCLRQWAKLNALHNLLGHNCAVCL